LFDNVHETEICDLCTLAISPVEAANICSTSAVYSTSPENVALSLVEVAHHRSQDKNAITPFVLKAQMAGVIGQLESRVGGKPDDVAMIACWAVARPAGGSESE